MEKITLDVLGKRENNGHRQLIEGDDLLDMFRHGVSPGVGHYMDTSRRIWMWDEVRKQCVALSLAITFTINPRLRP